MVCQLSTIACLFWKNCAQKWIQSLYCEHYNHHAGTLYEKNWSKTTAIFVENSNNCLHCFRPSHYSPESTPIDKAVVIVAVMKNVVPRKYSDIHPRNILTKVCEKILFRNKTSQNCTLLFSQNIFCSWYHTKSRLGWVGARQIFFWYDNHKDLTTCFCMTQLMWWSTLLYFQLAFPVNIPAPYDRPHVREKDKPCVDWFLHLKYSKPYAPQCQWEPGRQVFIFIVEWIILIEYDIHIL